MNRKSFWESVPLWKLEKEFSLSLNCFLSESLDFKFKRDTLRPKQNIRPLPGFFMSNQFKALTERQRVLMEMAQPITYKPLDDGDDLLIHFYFPKNLKEGDPKSLFLFFNSGAFDRGNPIQFAPHALYFVERGAVCGLVEYRSKATHSSCFPTDAMQDGRSAIRFVRHHAEKFNINREKLAVFGAGAGGMIAGGAALDTSVPSDPGDFNMSSSRPNAAILFSPMIDVAKGDYGFDQFRDAGEAKRLGLSKSISSHCPPMQIIHGTADRLIPVARVEKFADKMAKRKNVCEFVPFEGRDNNYYNLNVDPVSYEACLTLIDNFLVKHEFLPENENEDGARLISWREQDF